MNDCSENRKNRLNKAKQLQKSKRNEIWLQQRIGASDGPPKVVGIVPLSAETNVFSVLQECLREASWTDQSGDLESNHLVNALYLKYKARCSFIVADNSLSSALDVGRVADIVILVVDGGTSQDYVIDEVFYFRVCCCFFVIMWIDTSEWNHYDFRNESEWVRCLRVLCSTSPTKETQVIY